MVTAKTIATPIPSGANRSPSRSYSGTISEPAWRTKPSWYLIATDDRMIPPETQHAIAKRAGAAIVEVKSSHAVYVSQSSAVAALFEHAAKRRRLLLLSASRAHWIKGVWSC